jgi:hypothetical protein
MSYSVTNTKIIEDSFANHPKAQYWSSRNKIDPE